MWHNCLRGNAAYQYIVYTQLFWDCHRKTDVFDKNFWHDDLNSKLCLPVWVVAKIYVKFLGFPLSAGLCEISRTHPQFREVIVFYTQIWGPHHFMAISFIRFPPLISIFCFSQPTSLGSALRKSYVKLELTQYKGQIPFIFYFLFVTLKYKQFIMYFSESL